MRMRPWRKPLLCQTMQPEHSAAAQRAAKLLIWVIPLLWIVNSVIARRASGVITPHVLAWGRWALAGAILAWVTRAELAQHSQQLRTHARRYLLLGACGMWICGAANPHSTRKIGRAHV